MRIELHSQPPILYEAPTNMWFQGRTFVVGLQASEIECKRDKDTKDEG
uniref:Uncharacterized protein n=1 Tax=Arundo donax TaxID=35708 RepID=A0A0A9E5S9_ARUDO